MKRAVFLFLLSLFVFRSALFGAGVVVPESEKAVYRLGMWDDTDRGSHRAVIQVSESDAGADAVSVHIPWRRRDRNPEAKRLILTDESGRLVKNLRAVSLSRESADLVFQPVSGAGIYYLYYLPHNVQPGSGYYGGGYLEPEETAEPDWLARISPNAVFPKAELTALEARGAFESFYPMEVTATESERAALIEANREQPVLLFPEDREHPIVMTDDIPLRWAESGPSHQFTGTADRNEYYAFQVGVFAASVPVSNLSARSADLVSEDGKNTISADRITCFNLGGINSRGEPFTKRIDLEQGKTQALWFGVDVAEDTVPGTYTGSLVLGGEGVAEQTVSVCITVTDSVIPDRGDNEPWRHSRLRWLNSTLGIDDFVYPPFTDVVADADSVQIAGRTICYGANGLPSSIVSEGNELLDAPVRFTLTPKGGEPIEAAGTLEQNAHNTGTARYSADVSFVNADRAVLPVRCRIASKIDFDGYLRYTAELTASEAVDLDDITLEIPFVKEQVPYLMGLGQDGGIRPDSCRWEWGGKVYYDSFWLGGAHAGLQCELRGANYAGPMVNLYWPIGQLTPPETWYNGGNGSCTMETSGNRVTVRASGGARRLEAGETVPFEWTFIVTPVKPLNPAKQFASRYYHSTDQISTVKKSGANVINIHHATALNLYINYPFLTVDRLSAHIRAAHEAGLKVKIYYTVRELTNHVTEWAAVRSLGTEILADGNGGGYPWLREHFGDHYTPAWYDRLESDRETLNGMAEVSAAVVTSGDSRWLNYYVEGLHWLVTHLEIDGLYLDDVSYDRSILKRMRSVMERNRPGCMIDLHSNTAFSHNPANQYLEFFPFIDKLWFGESFDYEGSDPAYWLTEISGIPYGVMSEMLQNGGNPWRGMVYGMTDRLPQGAFLRACTERMWRVWDEFGIEDAKMVGYWEPDAPIRTDQDDVLVTSYVREGKTLIALASWHSEPVSCRLLVDWEKLGLDPDKVIITAPDMMEETADKDGVKKSVGFQSGRVFRPDEPIPVEPGKGWVLILSEEERL